MFGVFRLGKRFAGTLLALLLLALPVFATGATYYVDTAGNDANDGLTPATAWKTITYAAANVPAGTSGSPSDIMVAAGTYDNTTNGESYPIMFNNDYVSLSGAGSGTTTIDAESLNTILNVDAKGFSISDFTFENTSHAIDISEGGFSVTNNVFESTVGTGVNFYSINTALGTSISFADMTVTNNTFMTTSNGVYVYVEMFFVGMTDGLSATFGNFTCTGNTFALTSGYGVHFDGLYLYYLNNGTATFGNITVANNTFADGSYGFAFYGDINDLEDTQVTVGDMTVSNNIFTDQTSYALDIDYWEVYNLNGMSDALLGDITISNNMISSDTGSSEGIYLDDLADIQYIYDESTVTTGAITITDNTIFVDDYGMYVYFYYIYDLGEEYWGDTVQVTMGPTTITGNAITSKDSYGAYIEYYEIAYDVYGESSVVLHPFTFSNNTVNSYYEALYFDVDYLGESMYEDSSLLVHPVTITNNTLNSSDDDGLYMALEDIGNSLYDNASVTVQDFTISNNTISGADDNGLFIYFFYNGYSLYDYSVLSMSPITIDSNTIFGGYGPGFHVNNRYSGSYMEDYASATLPDWIITNNSIDTQQDYKGIFIQNFFNDYYNYDYSDVYLGSTLIDSNIINPEGDAGMDVGIDIFYNNTGYYSEGASVATFGDFIITNNQIYNAEDTGIWFRMNEFGDYFYDRHVLIHGDIEIADNLIDRGDYGIYGEFKDNHTNEGALLTLGSVNIHDNTLTNMVDTGIYLYYYNYNDDPDDASLTIGAPMITGNTISGFPGFDEGIYLYVYNDPDGITMGTPSLTGNMVSGFDYGIYLDLDDQDTATLSCNYLENNDDIGLYITSDATGLMVTDNSFVNNTTWGLSIDDGDTAVVNAENNWWGDKLGPGACASCNGVNPGTMGTVDYDPWLTYRPQPFRCGQPFPWILFTPATTAMGPVVP